MTRIADGFEVPKESIVDLVEGDTFSAPEGYEVTNRIFYYGLQGTVEEKAAQMLGMLSGQGSVAIQPRIEELGDGKWIIAADSERQWLVDTDILQNLINGEIVLD